MKKSNNTATERRPENTKPWEEKHRKKHWKPMGCVPMD